MPASMAAAAIPPPVPVAPAADAGAAPAATAPDATIAVTDRDAAATVAASVSDVGPAAPSPGDAVAEVDDADLRVADAVIRPSAAPSGGAIRGEGKLIVACNVDGAEVYVDGRRLGVTPLRYPLLEGSHDVEVRLGGAVERRRVRVRYDREAPVSVHFAMGRLSVVGVPGGVVCSLDGRTLGRPALAGQAVPAGLHVLECDDPAGDGRKRHEVEIRPRGRHTVQYSAAFAP